MWPDRDSPKGLLTFAAFLRLINKCLHSFTTVRHFQNRGQCSPKNSTVQKHERKYVGKDLSHKIRYSLPRSSDKVFYRRTICLRPSWAAVRLGWNLLSILWGHCGCKVLRNSANSCCGSLNRTSTSVVCNYQSFQRSESAREIKGCRGKVPSLHYHAKSNN